MDRFLDIHLRAGEVIDDGWPGARPGEGKWLDGMVAKLRTTRLADAAKLPLGVFINPRDLSHGPDDARSCREAAELLTVRALQLQARGQEETTLDYLTTALALSRHLRHRAPEFAYREGVTTERVALTGFGYWLGGVSRLELLRRALRELKDHEATTPPVTDALASEYLRYRDSLGIGSRGGRADELESYLMQVPWESERARRLTDAVFTGRRRVAESEGVVPLNDEGVLGDWEPTANGPSRERMERLLESSWIAGSLPVTVPVQRASRLSQCRIRAARLQAALAIYQVEHGKPAENLDDLPPDLPTDPFSGKPFGYRLSRGEWLSWQRQAAGGGWEFTRHVPAGQGIMWSAGPDGNDDGGTRQWFGEGWDGRSQDLIFLVPRSKR